MGAIVCFVISLVLVFVFAFLTSRCDKAGWRHPEPWWSCLEIPFGVCCGISVVLAVVLSFCSIASVSTMANLDALQQENRVQGAVYATLLVNYDEMRRNDVTASETYMTLYSDILNFNRECEKAQKWEGKWWAEGIFYNPSYSGVEPVELTLG
jgi:hypothetical protein